MSVELQLVSQVRSGGGGVVFLGRCAKDVDARDLLSVRGTVRAVCPVRRVEVQFSGGVHPWCDDISCKYWGT